jgi:hypothetical protein
MSDVEWLREETGADVLGFQAEREQNAEGRRRITEIVEDHDLPY